VGNILTSVLTNGFDIGSSARANSSGVTYASWTFREQPKFFDVVTYTGNFISGVGGTQTISHNLGSVPGCIIVKSTSVSGYWTVYHRQLGNNKYLELNSTNQANTNANVWNSTDPTSTQFSVGQYADVNTSGETFVAYVFAHDAGGFGLTGTDNVISCGSFTGSASGTTVNLGWEPQWVLIKRSSGNTDNWRIYDNMRGMTASNGGQLLYADTAGSETTNSRISVNATGFGFVDDAAYGNIYIAIRRGPMKVPTSGTSVFTPVAVASSTSNGTQIANSFVTDMAIGTWRDGVVEKGVNDRLRGISTTNPSGSGNPLLKTNTTGAETTPSNIIFQGNGNATMLGQYFAGQGYNQIYWLFGRAPSVFDIVCYTGDGKC
jgi:hypothetical protein